VSEDSHLNGVYSSTLVRAFQGDDPKHLAVACTCKHFIGYSLEGGPAAGGFSRHNFDAKISEQDMQESYLPPFKMCVTDGKPAQIMCSYNAVNGVPSCLRGDVQNGLIRKQWGFEGLIVSDQDSIRDAWAGRGNGTNHGERAATLFGLGNVARLRPCRPISFCSNRDSVG
jgi:beta-glucosidase-like glycosyl hydrolase